MGSDRRSLLKLLAAIAGAGAVTYGVHSAITPRTPGPVRSVEFRGIDHSFDDHPMSGTPVQPGDEPVVTQTDDGTRITVEGTHWYGSSSCDTSVFGGVEYNEDASEVRAYVESERQRMSYLSLGCTADLAGTQYRLTVGFDDPPKRFVMVEEHSTSTSTTAAEIDK